MSDLRTTEPIEITSEQNRRMPADVSKIIVEEVVKAIRQGRKEDLGRELRDRARKGLFKQRTT